MCFKALYFDSTRRFPERLYTKAMESEDLQEFNSNNQVNISDIATTDRPGGNMGLRMRIKFCKGFFSLGCQVAFKWSWQGGTRNYRERRLTTSKKTWTWHPPKSLAWLKVSVMPVVEEGLGHRNIPGVHWLLSQPCQTDERQVNWETVSKHEEDRRRHSV